MLTAPPQANLIRQVLMLHAIRYYMKTLVTLSEQSAHDVYTSMPNLASYYNPYPCSRLLSRQIKYAMDRLGREITSKVLKSLELTMRSRSEESWGLSFCALLILCLCMEELEIAADIFVVADMDQEGANSAYDRRQSLAACQALEDNPFLQFKRLFHDIYRSHRKSRRAGQGFNPLQKLAKKGGTAGSDQPMDRMVKSIYQLIYGSCKNIEVPKQVSLSFMLKFYR